MSEMGSPFSPQQAPQPQVTGSRAMPQAGFVQDGYRFMGGNPADKAAWQPLQGQEFLQSLPPVDAAVVQAMVEGRKQWPGGFATKIPYWQQKIEQAAQYDPNFDETSYGVRMATRKDFTSGKTANLIQALNQAPLHALTMADAYDQLHNLPVGGETVNDFLTNAESMMGLQGQQAAMGAFKESQPAVSSELATVYKGGPATIPDIEAQARAFPMGAAPTTSNSALKAASELMKDRLDTINQRWQNAMGPLGGQFPAISPRAKAALDTLYARYHPEAQQQNSGWHVQALP